MIYWIFHWNLLWSLKLSRKVEIECHLRNTKLIIEKKFRPLRTIFSVLIPSNLSAGLFQGWSHIIFRSRNEILLNVISTVYFITFMENFEVEDGYAKTIALYIGESWQYSCEELIFFIVEEKMEKISACGWISIFISFIVILIVSIILISLSFSYVEYNEYAFRKNTASNEVDTTHVYENGRESDWWFKINLLV